MLLTESPRAVHWQSFWRCRWLWPWLSEWLWEWLFRLSGLTWPRKCETISWPAINCWFGSRYDWAKTRDLVWHDEHWCIEPGARITYSRIWVATMMPMSNRTWAWQAHWRQTWNICVGYLLYELICMPLQSILELLDALSSFSTHWLYGDCLNERWRWSSGLCWCCWKSWRGSIWVVLTFHGFTSFTIQWTTVCKIALNKARRAP